MSLHYLVKFCAKNCNDPELSEAKFHARLSHSKQLLRNVHPVMLASFCSLNKRYLQWPHWKTHRMTDCTAHMSTKKKAFMTKRLCTQLSSVTDGISRWVTSGWHYTSLHTCQPESRLLRSINCNMLLLQQFLPAICHLSGKAIKFPHNFARRWAV